MGKKRQGVAFSAVLSKGGGFIFSGGVGAKGGGDGGVQAGRPAWQAAQRWAQQMGRVGDRHRANRVCRNTGGGRGRLRYWYRQGTGRGAGPPAQRPEKQRNFERSAPPVAVIA